jgi:hypothetical protein
LKEELEILKVFLKDTMKITLTSLESSQDQFLGDRFSFARLENYKAQDSSNSMLQKEVRLLALGDQDFYIFALLVSPAKEADLYNWGRNTRSFSETIKTIK